MRLHYYPETDSLYIELADDPGAETRGVSDGVNVDIGRDGNVVGFNIDRASAVTDLSFLDAKVLPLRQYEVP